MQQVGNSLGVAITGVVFYGALDHGVATAFERSLMQLTILYRGGRPQPSAPGTAATAGRGCAGRDGNFGAGTGRDADAIVGAGTSRNSNGRAADERRGGLTMLPDTTTRAHRRRAHRGPSKLLAWATA